MKWTTWLALGFLLLIVFWGISKLADDQFSTPQSYMSLVRVQQLHQDWNWHDSTIHRSNIPYGEKIAASRSFDLVLLIPALIGSLFLGFAKALSLSGTIIGPLLGFGAIAFFLLTSRPSKVTHALAQATILGFLLLPWFAPGRCEPNQLLVVLFAALFYTMERLFRNPTESKWAYISGAILALAMWTQVEAIIFILVVQAAFVALWFIGDLPIARIASLQSRALLLASLVVFAIERPYSEWFHVGLEKLSAGHLLIFGILVATWSIMSTFVNVGRLKRAQERIWWTFRSFLIGVFILFFSFREFISSPLPVYPPEAMLYWYNDIAEKLPLVREPWSVISLFLFGVVVGLGFALYQSIRSGIAERRWWFLLTSGIVFFTLFALLKDRFWLACDLIILLSAWISFKRHSSKKMAQKSIISEKVFFNSDILLLISTPIICVLGIFFSSYYAWADFAFRNKINAPQNLNVICTFLESHYSEGKPRRILAYIDYGPEILYRTRHEVVVIPYGNRKAIYDERAFMFAEDLDLSRIVAQERKIDTVIVTPLSQAEKDHYPAGENFPSMHRKLIAGEHPRWMSMVKLPEVAKQFCVYEISPEVLRSSQEPLMRITK